MHYYCTIVSKDYLHKGLVLYDSIKKYDMDFKMFFICMQDEVKDLLEKILQEKAVFIHIKAVEGQDRKLASVKAGRNEKEYAWTSKASIFLYLFNNYSELDHILWLDSDIIFYSSPEPIFSELSLCSVLLTRERFKGNNIKLNNVYGVYNTGLIGLRRDKNAVGFINWYRRKCIEWCYDKVHKGKWSDQMYLNKIHGNPGWIRVSKNTEINVTPWNIQGCMVKKLNDDIYVDGKKLIFYHYSGFKPLNAEEFELCTYIELQEDVVKLLYVPYVNSYKQMINYVNKFKSNLFKGAGLQGCIYKNYYRLNGDLVHE